MGSTHSCLYRLALFSNCKKFLPSFVSLIRHLSCLSILRSITLPVSLKLRIYCCNMCGFKLGWNLVGTHPITFLSNFRPEKNREFFLYNWPICELNISSRSLSSWMHYLYNWPICWYPLLVFSRMILPNVLFLQSLFRSKTHCLTCFYVLQFQPLSLPVFLL